MCGGESREDRTVSDPVGGDIAKQLGAGEGVHSAHCDTESCTLGLVALPYAGASLGQPRIVQRVY